MYVILTLDWLLILTLDWLLTLTLRCLLTLLTPLGSEPMVSKTPIASQDEVQATCASEGIATLYANVIPRTLWI